MVISQPVVSHAKSTNDLVAGQFWLEKGNGTDTGVAVGDIRNISDHPHENLRADIELRDRKGARLGVVSDYAAQLGAQQCWHVLVAVDNTNAASVKLVGLSGN